MARSLFLESMYKKEKKSKRYKCKKCPYSCNTIMGLMRHNTIKHTDDYRGRPRQTDKLRIVNHE